MQLYGLEMAYIWPTYGLHMANVTILLK